MKVGTDGVLLGAWATIDHDPYNISTLAVAPAWFR
jgi:tRNA1(Val) A37 N6-methylase TrmN6